MELSNYNVFLWYDDYTAIYNFLNGAFIILKGNISEGDLRQYVYQKKDDAIGILPELLKKGIVIKQSYTKKEELDSYEDYYIITNSTIFYRWEDESILFLMPGIKNEVKLDKKSSKIWVDFSKECKRVKDVKDDLAYLVSHTFNIPLLCLKEKRDLSSNVEFANRYIMKFYEKAIEGEKSEVEKKESINSLYLKLTNYCNLNCKMCGQAQNRVLLKNNVNYTLNVKDVCKFIDPILDELKYIYLWGGEPFLNTQWKEFALFFTKHQKYVSIATNGTLLHENVVDIIDSNVNEIVVSLDGPEDIHNSIRNSTQTFSQVISGIDAVNRMKLSRQNIPKIIVNCTITEDNLYYLYDVIRICMEINVSEVVFQLPIWVSKTMGEKYEKLCYEKWKISADSWKGFEKRYTMDLEYLTNFIKICKKKHHGFVKFFCGNVDSREKLDKYFQSEAAVTNVCVCDVLNRTIVIEANGEVVTCPDFPDIKLGNINNLSYESYACNSVKNMFELGFYENKGYSICLRCCHNLYIDEDENSMSKAHVK